MVDNTVDAAIQKLSESRAHELTGKWAEHELSSNQRATLIRLCSCSDFIYEQSLRHQPVFQHLVNSITHNFANTLPSFEDFTADFLQLNEIELMQALRVFRQIIMVELAARDFLNKQDIEATMLSLSLLADQFYRICRDWSVQQLAPRWGRALSSGNETIELIALGMGKLGGGELNFSSDIDLIFCYAEKGQTQGGRRSEDFQLYFTKLAQKIIQLLDTVTADGRVFRVDMRLRPFGDSGPLVSSFDAIEDYYQEQGREWERYALLKARPLGEVDGLSDSERTQQQTLMALLKPFVFRRYIDFSVIDSLRSMKRMIRQEVQRRQLANNIKLGEGGIREVEFIVQAMQMLRGGKEVQLQQPSLLSVLPEFVSLNVLSGKEAQQLREDYLWLRRCEQYLQAFADQQTQTLPSNVTDQARLLSLFQIASWSDFIQILAQINKRIHLIFDDVIGDPETQPEPVNRVDLSKWQQIWAQPEEDQAPGVTSKLISHLKPELLRAVSGARGREKLEQLMPMLLWQMVQQGLNEDAMREVLHLIRKIASRTTYLELLIENRGALTQLVKLCSSCRFIGSQLSKFPLLLDQLIDPKLLYQVPELSSYRRDLRRYLLRVEPDDLEQQMEVLRQFKLTSQLVVAACDVENIASLMQVSDHLTAIAEACLAQSVDLAWQQMVARYGNPEGARADCKNFAVIGYGKLGGYELGYGSDLDLVFVHGCSSVKPTDGQKSIDSRQFYLKLAQRIMHLFTTRTMSGQLYEIDTRLRPSGAAGLLAIHIDTFADYQRQEAWTWEHQALVRSRLVVGDESLNAKFETIRREILTQHRDQAELQINIVNMRQKMIDNLAKESDGAFDLKQSRGGIADIEFISQYLVLAHSHAYPELAVFPDNVRILQQACKQEVLSEADTATLSKAYIAYRERYHALSLNNQAKTVGRVEVEQYSSPVCQLWSELFGVDLL